jgi:2-keto-4-pentenoate hydratase
LTLAPNVQLVSAMSHLPADVTRHVVEAVLGVGCAEESNAVVFEYNTMNDAARIIASAWRDGRKIDALPVHCRPNSLEHGLRCQAALAGALNDEAVGWKLAATAESGQRHLKVSSPIPGRLFASRICHNGDVVPMQGNRMLVAECEFVFCMGLDLVARKEPYSRGEVLAAVSSLHPGLELPDSRFEDFTSVGAAQLAADNACAHWMVVGEATTAKWREMDLSAHATRIVINGDEVTRGLGSDVLGDPRDALTWLANAHALLGEGLRAGQMITTGVTGMPSAIAVGDKIVADLGEFGAVSATITD